MVSRRPTPREKHNEAITHCERAQLPAPFCRPFHGLAAGGLLRIVHVCSPRFFQAARASVRHAWGLSPGGGADVSTCIRGCGRIPTARSIGGVEPDGCTDGGSPRLPERERITCAQPGAA